MRNTEKKPESSLAGQVSLEQSVTSLEDQSKVINEVIRQNYARDIDKEIISLLNQEDTVGSQGLSEDDLKGDSQLLAYSPCFDGGEVVAFAKVNRDNTPKMDRNGALKLKGPIASINFMLPVFRSSVAEDFWSQYAFSELQQAELFDTFRISADDSLRGAFIKDDALITLLSKNKDSVKQNNLEFFRKNPMLALRQMKLWQAAYTNAAKLTKEEMTLSFDNFFPRSVLNEEEYTAVFSAVLLELANFKSYQNFKLSVSRGDMRLEDGENLPFDVEAASRKFSWDLNRVVSNPIELEIISAFKHFFGRTEFIDEYLRFTRDNFKSLDDNAISVNYLSQLRYAIGCFIPSRKRSANATATATDVFYDDAMSKATDYENAEIYLCNSDTPIWSSDLYRSLDRSTDETVRDYKMGVIDYQKHSEEILKHHDIECQVGAFEREFIENLSAPSGDRRTDTNEENVLAVDGDDMKYYVDRLLQTKGRLDLTSEVVLVLSKRDGECAVSKEEKKAVMGFVVMSVNRFTRQPDIKHHIILPEFENDFLRSHLREAVDRYAKAMLGIEIEEIKESAIATEEKTISYGHQHDLFASVQRDEVILPSFKRARSNSFEPLVPVLTGPRQAAESAVIRSQAKRRKAEGGTPTYRSRSPFYFDLFSLDGVECIDVTVTEGSSLGLS
jgi:hypothetical protein